MGFDQKKKKKKKKDKRRLIFHFQNDSSGHPATSHFLESAP